MAQWQRIMPLIFFNCDNEHIKILFDKNTLNDLEKDVRLTFLVLLIIVFFSLWLNYYMCS